MKRSLLLALPLLFSVACAMPAEEDDASVARLQAAGSLGGPGSFPTGPCPFGPNVAPATNNRTISFDDVASGTIVDSAYACYGVQFTCVMCSSGHAFALNDGFSNNAVSLFASGLPEYDARSGAVKAAFTSILDGSPRTRTTASVSARPVVFSEATTTPTAQPFLEAFDAGGTLLQKVLYPIAYGSAGWGSWQTLTIQRPQADIAYVYFSSQYTGNTPVYGEFDNFLAQ